MEVYFTMIRKIKHTPDLDMCYFFYLLQQAGMELLMANKPKAATGDKQIKVTISVPIFASNCFF